MVVPSQEREHGVVGVVGVEPLESGGVGVSSPQRRACVGERLISAIDVVDAAMGGVIEEMPRELGRIVPLLPGRELGAHEQQRCAGERPLPGEQGSEPGELLPVVASHLRQQAALAVHDLVVAERQDEALVVGVELREGHLVVVVGAVDRIELHVAERVVHPAEIPLVAEPQATIGRPGG